MTIRYVGIGGNNGNSGLTWALRKLTLTGAEDTPVAEGDTVYVGPGTYREALTCDVSGSAGNPITYIGDYSGVNTDGVGGLVRLTGSDNDQTAVRTQAVDLGVRTYRTFSGFQIDTLTGQGFYGGTSDNCIIEKCLIIQNMCIAGYRATNLIVRKCASIGAQGTLLGFTPGIDVQNANALIENCIVVAGNAGGFLSTNQTGGVTIKNSLSLASYRCVNIATVLPAGYTPVTVNNCIIAGASVAFYATATGEIVEDYNDLWLVPTARTNTSTGANSKTYPPLLDTRWFFEMISSNGRMTSPFDLSSYSQLINLAGTSPSATDMRGTGTIGAQREWGALEYDPALLFRPLMASQTIVGQSVTRNAVW